MYHNLFISIIVDLHTSYFIYNHILIYFLLPPARYVYKRLRFLNNRYISQFAALVFLAVWHGLHSGYYACFFMEFVVINFEKDVSHRLWRRLLLLTYATHHDIFYCVINKRVRVLEILKLFIFIWKNILLVIRIY